MFPTRLLKTLCRFIGDGGGNIAMMFGLMLIPLTLAAGVGIDYAQAQHFKTILQGDADAAALAGASVYKDSSSSGTATTVATNYMNNAVSHLPPHQSVSFTVTPSSTSAAFNVLVTATATVSTSFMSLVSINTTSVNVTAGAQNPVTTVNFSLNGFFSNACDGNTIYWYQIPSASDPTTYVPPAANLNQIWTNTTSSPPPSSFTLTSSSQRIGFALKNKTGQLCNYGSNSFGGAYSSTHMFYSNLYPPSKVAYPSVTNNHTLQVATIPSGKTLSDVLPTLPKTTFNSNSPYAAPTCGDIDGQTMLYAFNDMGGGGDDLDYNDAAFSFSCSGTTNNGGSGSSTVVLTQ